MEHNFWDKTLVSQEKVMESKMEEEKFPLPSYPNIPTIITCMDPFIIDKNETTSSGKDELNFDVI